MKHTLLAILSLLVISSSAQSTVGKGTTKTKPAFKAKWSANPFDHQVFIENRGQFDNDVPAGTKVLFMTVLGSVNAYFTPNGIIYRYRQISPGNSPGADPDAKPIEVKTFYQNLSWQGSNSNVTVTANDKRSDSYIYTIGEKSSLSVNIFRKLVYQNMYPRIDVEYTFINGKDGMEYSLIVHPGADLSKVKFKYSGTKNISIDASGNLVVPAPLNTLKEYAPTAFYADNHSRVQTRFNVQNNEVNFNITNLDPSKTLVIDPWVTNPNFTAAGWDKAYDLDWDNKGNVYVYGGDCTSLLQLIKFNSLGVLQWTYNATSISTGEYGDFTTDKVTGTSYLAQGFSGGKVLKVNTNGTLLATFPGNPSMDEIWRTEYNACTGQIILGAGGTSGINQAATLDTNMVSVNMVNALGASTAFHDVCLEALDPSGQNCYMAVSKSVFVDPLHFNNYIMKLPLPALSPTTYNVPDSLPFVEYYSIFYSGTYTTNGMNGAACSSNWLYLYDGDTLERVNKSTGAFVARVTPRTNSPFKYGGLDVDRYDNVFAGVADSIYVYDSALAIIAKIPLVDTVYDLHLGQNNTLYACGHGFVAQLTQSVTQKLLTTTVTLPTSCSACNGKATVTVNQGTPPYTYLWSNGQTGATDSNLCAGIYTVTVTDGSCPQNKDTAVVIISSIAGYGATLTDTNPSACLSSQGSITASAFGGTGPYTYSWSNGSTDARNTGLIAGSYTLTVTDANGCTYFVTTTLVNPVPMQVSVSPTIDSICNGSGVGLTASGVSTYSWVPATGLSCTNCPNPTASPTVTTTYTVTGTDSNGCTSTASVTIKMRTPPAVNIYVYPADSICAGDSALLAVQGGCTYLWSNGATTDSLWVKPAVNTTYSVQVTCSGCSNTGSKTIYIKPLCCTNNYNEQICYVTVDTSVNKNKIVWQRLNSPPNGGYDIYKENSSFSFSMIASQPLVNFSTYIDTASYPMDTSATYALATYDSCGISALSNPHTTIFLYTYYDTTQNKMILYWTPYIGIPINSYNVFRGPNIHSLSMIASLSGNTYSYTDSLPPPNSVYLIGAIDSFLTCTPSRIRSGGGEGVTTFSNPFKRHPLGVNTINDLANKLIVYPVPARSYVMLDFGKLVRDEKFEVMNTLGQVMDAGLITGTKYRLDVASYASGIYVVKLTDSSGTHFKDVRFIIAK